MAECHFETSHTAMDGGSALTPEAVEDILTAAGRRQAQTSAARDAYAARLDERAALLGLTPAEYRQKYMRELALASARARRLRRSRRLQQAAFEAAQRARGEADCE